MRVPEDAPPPSPELFFCEQHYGKSTRPAVQLSEEERTAVVKVVRRRVRELARMLHVESAAASTMGGYSQMRARAKELAPQIQEHMTLAQALEHLES